MVIRGVTLFGKSAGSADAVALVGSPLTQGLFAHAAIETAFYWDLTGAGNALADREQRGLDFAAAVGCTRPAAVDCLRARPASTLILADTGDGYGPVVGGTVQPRSALAAITDRGARVPLLVGSNREEIGYDIYALPDPFIHGDYTRSVQDMLGSKNEATAFDLYPSSSYDSDVWNLVTMESDGSATCPTRRLTLAAAAKGPTFRYQYTHVMENGADQASARASHTFEDTVLWHHFWPSFAGVPYVPTAAEEALSASMATYWTNFAKTGDPNGAGVPVWPRYEGSRERYQVLDDSVHTDAAYHVPQCGLMDAAFPSQTCGSVCHFFSSRFWRRFH